MARELRYTIFTVKWGFFGLLASENALLRTSLPAHTAQIAKKYLLVGINCRPAFTQELCPDLQKMITDYFNGCYVDFRDVKIGKILPNGSDFGKKILKTCRTIKFGQTISYGQLAKRAGFGLAARAVGTILAKNALPLIIPCHRVIRGDGGIGGFSANGGEKVKKRMLELEQYEREDSNRICSVR